MIIFVHTPKAGGTSLLKAVEKAYGTRLLKDYNYDAPPEQNIPFFNERREIIHEEVKAKKDLLISEYDIIFGHYRADKYNFLLPSIKRAMFFREPIARVCSEYFYHKRTGNFTNTEGRENISLVDFAQLPSMVDYYEQYLGGVAIDNLDYIGIVEHFSASLELYNKIFNIHLEQKQENKGEITDYFAYLKKENIFEQIIASQENNQKIYYHALEKFSKLYQTYI